MGGILWAALKRVFDLTFVPTVIGSAMYLGEKFLGLLTWVFVIIGNFLLWVVFQVIDLASIPDLAIDSSVFGSIFFQIASLAGIWQALLVYFGFALAAFVARLVTLGVVGRS